VSVLVQKMKEPLEILTVQNLKRVKLTNLKQLVQILILVLPVKTLIVTLPRKVNLELKKKKKTKMNMMNRLPENLIILKNLKPVKKLKYFLMKDHLGKQILILKLRSIAKLRLQGLVLCTEYF